MCFSMSSCESEVGPACVATPARLQCPYALKIQYLRCLATCLDRSDHCKHSTAELHLVERKANQGTCDSLTEASNAHNIDVLFIGSFGRKRDGGQGMEVHIGLLGTVADGSLRRGTADVCMVKSTSFAIPTRAKFLVCVDFSDSSGMAMACALHFTIFPMQ
jgi:hypothetical protein